MVETPPPAIEAKPLLSASMFGNTTPIVNRCRETMEGKGYEVLVFHAVGTGGQTMSGHVDDVIEATHDGQVAVVVDCIHENRGNGYIWHTTGSGKTLTSFKASTLLKLNPDIYKCLFVVDRKDLDRQTREEFNRFQEGCVEENTNTAALVRRLVSDDYADKVIVTTIQKLGLDALRSYNQ